MSKYNYSDFERQLNMVLAHQSAELSEIHFPSTESADACIASSEALLRKLGYKIEKPNLQVVSNNRRTVIVKKPEMQDAYVRGKIEDELFNVLSSTNEMFEDFTKDYIVVFE